LDFASNKLNKGMRFKHWPEVVRSMATKDTMMESGFARVRRLMFGDVPSIRTIGIVTAQNPNGQSPWPANDIENHASSKSLEEYLRTRNLGPVKVKGKFGLHEDSFLIPNIPKEELVNIGRWFELESVIWGEKGHDRNKNPFFWFEYIDTQSGQTKSTRMTPWTADELTNKVRKAETFAIPFFDDPSAELIFDGKVNEMTYYSDRLPDDPVVRQLVEDIRCHAEALEAQEYSPSRTKSSWHHRGIIRECLWKLNRLP
jgi:hypothetical protein